MNIIFWRGMNFDPAQESVENDDDYDGEDADQK